MSGQDAERSIIQNITNSTDCIVTTTLAHGYDTGAFVRLTDLNGSIPIHRGMDQINNRKFKIIKISDTSFYIVDPITNHKIDSSNYTPYISDGYCNIVQEDFVYEE